MRYKLSDQICHCLDAIVQLFTITETEKSTILILLRLSKKISSKCDIEIDLKIVWKKKMKKEMKKDERK